VSDSAYNVLKILIARSDDIADAVERMTPEDKELYEETVQFLHVELQLLATTSEEGQQQYHKDNIAHLKSALSSLDAVADIKVYKTTIKVLGEILKTAVMVALAL
jgi:hypothetical protein